MTPAELFVMLWAMGIVVASYALGAGAAWALSMWQRRRQVKAMHKARKPYAGHVPPKAMPLPPADMTRCPPMPAVKPFQGVDFGRADGQRFVRCAACDAVTPLDALTVKCKCGNVLSRWHSHAP